jgi:K+/H+ antiporter YhaU regulatory subunit KhtT
MDEHHARTEVVNVREYPMPGADRLYEVVLTDGTALRIAVDGDSDGSELGVIPAGADEAAVRVRLTGAEASTVSSLLSGVRLVVRNYDRAPRDGAATRTVTIPDGSPVVGIPLDEVDLPDPDEARIVAVIRDETEQLLEEDPGHRCRAGDRLVLVGRHPALDRLVSRLTE